MAHSHHPPGVVADIHLCVSDVIFGVDDEDRENIRGFADFIEEWAQTSRIVLAESCFYHLVASFGVYELHKLHADLLKERSPLSAFWVIFLRAYRMSLVDDSVFKYKKLEDFMAEYGSEFEAYDMSERMKLFYTANWMALVLKMVPAKRNKGFFLHVIPKLVEGFSSKYVTGSGQSKTTSDRVKIFEHEGNVKKSVRKGRLSSSPPSTDEESSHNGGVSRESSASSGSHVSSFSFLAGINSSPPQLGRHGLFSRENSATFGATREAVPMMPSSSYWGGFTRESSAMSQGGWTVPPSRDNSFKSSIAPPSIFSRESSFREPIYGAGGVGLLPKQNEEDDGDQDNLMSI